MEACLQEGVIALWKGWLPSVIGVIPYVGLNFAVYETLKDVVLKFYGEPNLTVPIKYSLGLVCSHACKSAQQYQGSESFVNLPLTSRWGGRNLHSYHIRNYLGGHGKKCLNTPLRRCRRACRLQ